ncbi:hypothetical protein TVAG_347470 [Trichomonas vaginalis G3]|uniref:Uncharacterized protein n=1 Tax=Trichomonas vaginalis (strain ATCC PRA-98 / G3) TaxID=412133 RepID=A2FNQ9_TRIV3|nr:hypothetical protein TVAGG3_0367530 [Trichomonas vaginalis G3]EAX93460.1 hypothetical protein TVAG_347470 [Trichomonas vaginalis G3]KAI5532377.1 hypothetical protein TVAGG3_0367530 [Trichomonas vaginalis G3]|eukprot:XP_001306390.1 hypothetical protein [Trichomonas vaginalis G3]
MQSFSYIFVKDNQKNDYLGIKIVIPRTFDALVAAIRKKLNNYKFKSLFSSSSKLIRSISDVVPGETIYISNIDPNDTKNQIKHSKITTGKNKAKSQKVKQEDLAKSNTTDSKTLLERYNKAIENIKSTCLEETQPNTKTDNKSVKSKAKSVKKHTNKAKKTKVNTVKENKIPETKSETIPDTPPNNAFGHTQKPMDSPSNDQNIEIRTREVTFDTNITMLNDSDINFDLSPIYLKSDQSDEEEKTSNSSTSFKYSNHSHLDLTSDKLDVLLRLCPDVLEVLTDDDVSITYDI